MFTINYGDDKSLEIKVLFSTANSFAKKYCDNKSIVEVLPTKMAEFDGEFLVLLLNHFQTNDPKVSKEDIVKILDEVLADETKGLDIPAIYTEIIKEFDYAGVFKKGMGFTLAKKFQEQMKLLLEENQEADQ